MPGPDLITFCAPYNCIFTISGQSLDSIQAETCRSHTFSVAPLASLLRAFFSNTNYILIIIFWSPERNRPGLSQNLGQGTYLGWGDLRKRP